MNIEKMVEEIAKILDLDIKEYIWKALLTAENVTPAQGAVGVTILTAKTYDDFLSVYRNTSDPDIKNRALDSAYELAHKLEKIYAKINSANSIAECKNIFNMLDIDSQEAMSCIRKLSLILEKEESLIGSQ